MHSKCFTTTEPLWICPLLAPDFREALVRHLLRAERTLWSVQVLVCFANFGVSRHLALRLRHIRP